MIWIQVDSYWAPKLDGFESKKHVRVHCCFNNLTKSPWLVSRFHAELAEFWSSDWWKIHGVWWLSRAKAPYIWCLDLIPWCSNHPKSWTDLHHISMMSSLNLIRSPFFPYEKFMKKYPHSVLVIVSMNIYGSYEKSGRCIPMKNHILKIIPMI